MILSHSWKLHILVGTNSGIFQILLDKLDSAGRGFPSAVNTGGVFPSRTYGLSMFGISQSPRRDRPETTLWRLRPSQYAMSGYTALNIHFRTTGRKQCNYLGKGGD